MNPCTLYEGDCLDVLQFLDVGSVHTCVTSPPYFGLRDYGHDGQLGLEPTPDEFVAALVAVFREVRRVLRDDGTVWLNLGDSYNAAGRKGHGARTGYKQGTNRASAAGHDTCRPSVESLKEKDLIGIPWRVAFALQADGWYLRQDIIWAKPNPMPESVRDRCTKSHEYIFLLSKSPRYYFDHEAIKEPLASSSVARLSQPTLSSQAGSDRVPGKTNGNMKAVGKLRSGNKVRKQRPGADTLGRGAQAGSVPWEDTTGLRNKRGVWTVTTKPYKGAHFATFPPDLIEPCVLAGCPEGGTVLDPFCGSGTTGAVALKHGRKFCGIDINPEYLDLARRRIGEKA